MKPPGSAWTRYGYEAHLTHAVCAALARADAQGVVMQMSAVVDLCTALCLKADPGPLGVTFRWSEPGSTGSLVRVWYRIESGSGIAGRGDAWGVTRLPNGPAYPKVRTRRALRRQLLEIMAEGFRPEPRPGFEIYARWHTTGGLSGASSVQWFQRRARRGGLR